MVKTSAMTGNKGGHNKQQYKLMVSQISHVHDGFIAL